MQGMTDRWCRGFDIAQHSCVPVSEFAKPNRSPEIEELQPSLFRSRLRPGSAYVWLILDVEIVIRIGYRGLDTKRQS